MGSPSVRGCIARLASHRAWVGICAAAVVFAHGVCAPGVWGQPEEPVGERRPAFSLRAARVFDFEEIETSPAPVPTYWVRAQDSPSAGRSRPGFPIWNAAELDGTHTHSGKGAVKLPTRGGSTSLLLERGVLPIFQKADYVLTGYVLTEGLVHARARLVARLLDATGELVAGSERLSELVESPGRWSAVSVELGGDYEKASFLQIELQLVQPQQFEARTIGTRQVFDEDFEGAAWFDDVGVSQAPRIEISTASAGNIITYPARPDINFLVRDLTGEKLGIELEVFDADGQVVDRQSRRMTSGRTLAAWQPGLTKLGWYRAMLTVSGGGRDEGKVLASTHVDFLWIPSPGHAEPAGIRRELSGAGTEWRRFEMIALEPRAELSAVLADLLDHTGVGAVTVPVWEGLFESEEGAGKGQGGALIGRLLDRGHQVTLSVPRLSQALAEEAKVDPDDPWELARRGPELWAPFVDRYLDRFGQSVRRWQVGPAWDDRVFWDSGRERTLESVLNVFGRLVPGPILCLPWRADLAGSDRLMAQLPEEAALRILVPEDMPGSAIGDVARAWRGVSGGGKGWGGGHEVTVVLGSGFGERYGVRGTASEVARRLAEYWKGFGDDPRSSVALLEPWTWSEGQRVQMQPKAELAVLANMIQRLSGRRFVGELPTRPGVRALVFSSRNTTDAADQGLLIAWNESSPSPDEVIRASLGGSGSRVYDIMGNQIARGDEGDSAAIFRTSSPGPGRAEEILLRVGDEPVIVEGLDARLALFQARIRIEPDTIEANSKTHQHDIVVQNPWPAPVEVSVRVVKPGGIEGAGASRRDRSWRVAPRQARVIVDPGKEERIPIEVAFSAGEEAGTKDFVFDIEAATDQSLGTMRIHRSVEVGSSQLDVQVTAKVDPDGDVVVEGYISNRGQDPLDLELTAFAPGLSRMKSVMSNLMPGAVGVRAFRYEGAAAGLKGERVYVTVEDVVKGLRLNKAVVIE